MMMFHRSSPAAAEEMVRPSAAASEGSSTRTWSISSRGSTVSMSSSSSSGMSNDHKHHDVADGSVDEQEVVGVAVGKEVKECKANLMWVLSNMDAILGNNDKQRNKAKVLLLHVHRPAKTIPFMGANFPADQLHESEVAAFRKAETETMNRTMAKYRVICARVKVPAVCKVAVEEQDDVARGVLNLVAENGITRLVIGAAADKRYNKRLTAPTSKIALSVRQQAPPTCSIWFLCKGNLVCTRLVISRASTRKSDEERKAAANHHQVQLGTFIQSLHLQDESSSSSITYQQQQQQLPRVPPPPPPAAAGGYNEMMHIRYEQKQDIRSIFAEAEKLRREKHDTMPLMSTQAQGQADDEQQQLMSVINDLQAKLSEAHCMLFSLERDQEDLRRQRDAAVQEAAALRDRVRQLEDQLIVATSRGFTELSYQGLQEATNNLDGTLKLGHKHKVGGYGSVYKAVLQLQDHDKPVVVAIKVLNPHGIIALRFQQQVEELRKLRHPNLVPVLGACLAPEAPALVYEFFPGGGGGSDGLEDRLLLLPWLERARIAAQVCSALIFLHQNDMVHGNLKPTNVLLENDAKLADYGLCRLLEPDDASGVMLRCSATSLAYMDPEFLATGELRPSSDVYAFGVLLLRLLTGRPAMGLVKQVQAALAEGNLPEIIDASAGCPQEQAHQLAHLGVKCCEMSSTNRPDLAGEMVTQTLGCYLHP